MARRSPDAADGAEVGADIAWNEVGWCHVTRWAGCSTTRSPGRAAGADWPRLDPLTRTEKPFLSDCCAASQPRRTDGPSADPRSVVVSASTPVGC